MRRPDIEIIARFMLCVLVAFSLFLGGCGDDSINTNTPEYIKEIATYREGYESIVVYFILADAYGDMTTCDGSATLIITDEDGALFVVSPYLDPEDFYETKSGQGAFERDVLVYSFGRISYSSFLNSRPSGRGMAKLEVRFHKEGEGIGTVLTASESVHF